MEKDAKKASIRPVLNINLKESDKPIAVFMHTTLRPVLKQQHVIICALIRKDKNLIKTDFPTKTGTQKEAFLKQVMQKNTELRNILIGTLIGCFKPAELEFYLQNQKEANRRMIEMTITRFLSEFLED